MAILRFLMTKAGVVLLIAAMVAGASVAYAAVRSTTDGHVPSSGVRVRHPVNVV